MTASPAGPPSLPRVLVNCDDLGMHSTINDAVVEILSEGLVLSASLMAVGVHFEDAVAKLLRAGVREIGVHLSLGSEYPLLPTRPLLPLAEVATLVAEDGMFHPDIRAVRDWLDPAQVRRELSMQIQRVRAAGLRITHLDGHMFFYEPTEGGPEVYSIVRSLAESFAVPLRPVRSVRGSARTLFLWDETPDSDSRVQRYRDWLRSEARDGCEVIIHPAKDPATLRPITRSADWRYADYRSFLRPSLEPTVNGCVELVSWPRLAPLRDRL